MKRALVIDGNSMFYRMYYATAKQVDYALEHNWTPNNAIKLMIDTVIKLSQKNNYSHYFIAFDHGKKTFRHDELEDYKTGRTKAPDELIKQMNDTIIMLKAMGYKVLSKENIEADDLIGSFVDLMNKQNIMVDVYSSDKDLLQLVNALCDVYLMKTGISNLEQYTNENFKDKFYGLKPQQVVDFKAIIGDSSDRLKGVKGIGPKTGISLILEYDNLENIYHHLNELKLSVQQKFITDKQSAFLSYKLATILKDQLSEYQSDDFILATKDTKIIQQMIDKYKLVKFKFLLQNQQIGLF